MKESIKCLLICVFSFIKGTVLVHFTDYFSTFSNARVMLVRKKKLENGTEMKSDFRAGNFSEIMRHVAP